jgi:hypothetical protein
MAERRPIRPAARTPPAPAGGDYSRAAKVAGAVGALVVPMLCLVLAVMLLGDESHPARRASLRAWMRLAIAAIVVTVVAFTLFILSGAAS